MVTATTGFRHSSIDVAERLLPALALQGGLARIEIARTLDDVARLLTPAALDSLDAVAFVNTTGDPGVPDLPALLDWIAAGHGFAATHSASDTYHHRPDFLAMLGNEFLTHGEQALVEAVVEQPSHPAVAHLGSRYRVFDEIYRFTTQNRASVTPLLALTRYPDDGLPMAGEDADLPLAWTRAHGRGRVFYTALGHRDELWGDAAFQQHVLGGLRWALGR
jgi:type 1 glutamine amidotransferase